MQEKRAISPTTAPVPYGGGHYSPGIVAGDLVFTSGQGPIAPGTNEILSGSIVEQTNLTVDNLEAILAAAGSSLERIVKATVYLADLDDWAAFNQVWRERIGGVPPARTAIRVDLIEGMLVEIDVIATS
jgi:2-iminobutanoate/2-iminopropanoate deaminase